MEPNTFMLVDDDDLFLSCVEHACDKVDSVHLVATARDGVEALETIARFLAEKKPLPSYLLIDLNMPKMDGFQLLMAISELKREKPSELSNLKGVAILTGTSYDQDRAKAAELGANKYLVKPSSLGGIRNLIVGVLAEEIVN